MEFAGETILPGEVRDLSLVVSQSYSGSDVPLPFRVVRGRAPGPTLLICAAVHGDELNGTGAIRELMLEPLELKAGTLVLVPVVNILGFERQARYLPDRRDLNRCFPGSAAGSLARRIAHTVFQELVAKCDLCIDLHTAAVQRTNFPNVRGDLNVPGVEELARTFGCSLVVNGPGIKGTLRGAATKAGIPAIILEAGEVWKVEPAVVELTLRGIRNVLIQQEMLDGRAEVPPYRAIFDETTWLRTEVGGMLRFHLAPGDVVEKGQLVARCTTLLGKERGRIVAPFDGVVLGETTLPTVKPGDPVCHLGLPREGIAPIIEAVRGLSEDSLHERVRDDLASSVAIGEADE